MGLYLKMGEPKALCRSRISWGELSAGWNAVYTLWGAGERKQKPCLGMGMVAVTQGQQPLTWVGGCRLCTLRYLGCALQHCQPACLDSPFCLYQIHHWAFLLLPFCPLSASPVPQHLPALSGDKAVAPPPPLLSPGQDLASLLTQWGKAGLNRTKVNPSNKVTDCSKRRVLGITFHSEVSPR